MQPRLTQRRRVSAASRWLACVLFGVLPGSWAATVESVAVLSNPIPSQPLAAALADFANRTHLQFVYITTIVRSRSSRDVPAGLEPADALVRLLDGTGLSFEFLNPRTVRIFEAATTAPAVRPKAGDAPGPRGGSPVEATHPTKDSGVLDDVIVTSQMRSEHVSTVPISISVVSAADLSREHITSIPDLSRSVPNVSFTTQGGPGLNTLEIRGVSSQAGTAAIGVYQNDVSLTTRNLYSQGIAEPRFFDLDRVEVLRGPQGTLYGGGALGGVIRFISKQPNLREFDATAAAEVSETGHGGENYNSEGVLNLPLIDGRLALRLGAQQGHDSGYIDQVSPTDLSVVAKGINGNRWTVAKAALKWQVTDAWFATPAIFYQRFSSDDIDTFFAAALSDQTAAGRLLQPFQTSKTVREPGTDRITIPSLTIEGNVGVADLTFVGSLYQRDFERKMDGTLANVDGLATLFPTGSDAANGIAALNSVIYLATRQVQKSFEARLASKPYSGSDAALSWIVGAFYLSSVTDLYDNEPVIGITRLFNQLGLNINDPAVFPGSFPGAWPAGDSSLYNHRYYNPSQRAVFGEVSYYIHPAIQLTLGLRYESAKDTFEHDGNYYYIACGRPDALGNTLGCPTHDAPPDQFFSASTPRLAATWEVGESKLVYVSATKGYREGGSNRLLPVHYGILSDLQSLGFCDGTPAGCAGAVPTAFKPDSLWSYELGGKSRLFGDRLSVDAAVYVLKWNDTQQNVVLPQTEAEFDWNAGHVTSYGVEVELKGRPTPDLSATIAGGYNHASFTDAVPGLGSNSGVLYVAKGSAVPGVPKFNASVVGEYTAIHSGRLTGFVRGSFHIVGSSRGTLILGAPDFSRPAYGTLDASAGLTIAGFEVSLFARNLNNSAAVIQRPTLNFASEAYTLQPRTIGLAFNYRYANR